MSSTFFCCSAEVPTFQMRKPSAMMSSTFRRGFSDEIGSWKIIFIAVRVRRSSAPDSFDMSRPANTTWPDFGGGNCMMALPVVDFPQPDSPTRPRVSPSFTSRLMFETACTFKPL